MNRSVRSTLILACAVSIGAAQTGCSLFASHQQAVSIQSSDPNGSIIVDGGAVGTGSASLMLARNKSHTVLVKTPDGRSGAATIGKHISGTGVLDLVGGCIFLVPFLGVLGPGFWDLDPEHVSVIVSYLDHANSPPVAFDGTAKSRETIALGESRR